MRRTNLFKATSVIITMSLCLSICSCSAKQSADDTETSTEAVTEEETISSSANNPSGNDVSANNAETVYESESETESEPSSEEGSVSEDETEDETEDVSTASETESSSVKKTTAAAETTTQIETVPETTTEAVTVQSVSASVSGTHYIGETLSGADFTVTVTMSDGSTLTNPEGWGAQPLTLGSASNLITVSYQGASVTITVNAENIPETTTAQIVAEATTQATAAATTAATTTAAETTTASGVEWVEWADGDWNYALAQALFIAQNEMRAEAGVDALTWDDQMYEAAKLCAKVCGDNGVIDHDLTAQYIDRVDRVAYSGETIKVMYCDNLEVVSYALYKTDDVSWYANEAAGYMRAIELSDAHYRTAISGAGQYGAIAAYNKINQGVYICYLFYEGDDTYLTYRIY